MFHELVDDPGEHTPDAIYERYEAELLAVLEGRGVESVAEASGVGAATLEGLLAGDSPELTLEEGAAILAARPEAPDADTIATLARDDLLMGMTTAVLDVEAVEGGVDGRMEAQEIQQKIEGRFPMTVGEYAVLHRFIDARRQ
jgi:hypothetical protein